MDLLERYFLVICGCVMSLNIAIWRSRLRLFVEAGRISPQEVQSFTRGALTATWVAVVAWWAIEQASSVNLKCMKWFDPSQPGSILFSVVTIGFAVAWLCWLWGAGGELIARVPGVFFTPAGLDSEFEASTVRLVITSVIVLGGLVATLVGGSKPPTSWCAG